MIRSLLKASRLSTTLDSGDTQISASCDTIDSYELETLEPRVLMSATGLAVDPDADATGTAVIVESGRTGRDARAAARMMGGARRSGGWGFPRTGRCGSGAKRCSTCLMTRTPIYVTRPWNSSPKRA